MRFFSPESEKAAERRLDAPPPVQAHRVSLRAYSYPTILGVTKMMSSRFWTAFDS